MKQKAKITILGLLTVALVACSSSTDDTMVEPTTKTELVPTATVADKRETFAFTANGTSMIAKIFIPSAYETNKNLPTIYLIDFKEQHFQIATDEFDKVIEGIKGVQGLDALVITLDEHMDIDLILPKDFEEYYNIFKEMTSYVDERYTGSTSRTFIARGSEAGLVLMTLFLEDKETSIFQNFIATDPAYIGNVISLIEKEEFPTEKENKKLHFSFSSTNNQAICTRLIDLINETQYPWLEFESLEYPNLTYENTYPTAFAHGLLFVFDD